MALTRITLTHKENGRIIATMRAERIIWVRVGWIRRALRWLNIY